ncbi:MAG TPA: cytochrome c oxidase subunit II [Candidatus Aquilonibacter sp.]|nr:cytochrome c oxidase subunit II [Candidatus Aquilonibacter sp.]
MWWLLHPQSAQAAVMQQTWIVSVCAAVLVALYVYGAILWCIFAYRRDRHEPQEFTGNPPLEIFYAVLPLLIVIGLFLVTFHDEMPVDHVSAHPENRVDVTAFRWSWRFGYDGDRIRTIGTPLSPPTLYLPIDRTTEVDLTTTDVNHSFWVPAFLFKRDAIPGMTNVFDLTPRKLGTYLSRCAQFCGLDHALMTFQVKVVPDAAYDRYIASNGVQKP